MIEVAYSDRKILLHQLTTDRSISHLRTVAIGPAVNIASRLENLTKEVKRSVLFSKAFVERAGGESKLEDVESYSLRG